MKNIHVLPTEKPSRLFKVSGELKLTRNFDFYNGSEYQNIYITSDEEIKEGDYVIWNGKVYKDSKRSFTGVDYSQCKKIILTTYQDLIADGVQAIDDSFLEWFVNNPSCEEIEIGDWFNEILSCCRSKEECHCNKKRIIIPKEEPKQETLEEASHTAWLNYEHVEGNLYSTSFKNGFKFGAKYQAERMYSEEEVEKMVRAAYTFGEKEFKYFGAFKEWFEQFKKKQ
jgi:hypothetical protein